MEADLLFIFHYLIFHFIDRCTRWHAAKVIPNTEETTLVDAIDELWIKLDGPTGELIMDGESGVARSKYAHNYLKRHGVTFALRAPGQHVGHIDRRGALLRTTILRVVEQCKAESLDINFTHIMSESVFCGNALVSVNNTSPYNAVYGRAPRLLPNLELGDTDSTDAAWQMDRIREISVQQMVEGTARTRASRALRTRTLPASRRKSGK